MSGQTSIYDYEADDEPDLEDLPECQREVYEAIELGPYGPREYARETDRVPGTVGNLLAQAREKMEGSR